MDIQKLNMPIDRGSMTAKFANKRSQGDAEVHTVVWPDPLHKPLINALNGLALVVAKECLLPVGTEGNLSIVEVGLADSDLGVVATMKGKVLHSNDMDKPELVDYLIKTDGILISRMSDNGKAVNAVLKEAEKYMTGERDQTDMFDNEADADTKPSESPDPPQTEAEKSESKPTTAKKSAKGGGRREPNLRAVKGGKAKTSTPKKAAAKSGTSKAK